MKVSTKWLNEYVQVDDLNAKDLAEKIERTSVEVDSTYRLEEGLKKIVVGHTVKVVDHPDSDHLHICQVDVGAEDLIQIVCGAPNIAANMNVIVALSGARIAGNYKIKRSKMRGEVSEGMICSLQEIGFEEKVVPKAYADGIYVLPQDAVPGEDVYKYLGMDEDIIEVDVTPNRGDMLSMRGVARDVAAMYNREVKFPETKMEESNSLKIEDYVQANVDEEIAPIYQLRVIDKVKVKPSPMWLQKRLWNAGIRPTNNVVDITNYILLDFGQPLHSFDYKKLNSKNIVVRLANAGEKITTLDGVQRELQSEDIVITDGNTPVALAGIMGGQTTEVDDQTQTVLLESAVFEPIHIRKTSRRENLHSDASMRFERGINRQTITEALNKAAAMIAELGEGNVVSGIATGSKYDVQNTKIQTSVNHINKVLGTDLSDVEIIEIFHRLGFDVQNNNGELMVEVPPFRWDISIEADLVEEVARIYGFDNIPTSLPYGATTPGHYTKAQKIERQTREILEASGLSQAVSYGLTTEQKAKRFLLADAVPTKLAFPMSSDRTTARMNIISGLLDDIAYNKARKVNDVALYEVGKVFLGDGKEIRPHEVTHVAGAMMGLTNESAWNTAKQPVDFYTIKGIVENLLNKLGVTTDVLYVASQTHDDMHPGRTADIYVGDQDQYIGFVGEVHPMLSKELGIDRTYVFELDLQKITDLPKEQAVYTPVSKFPEIKRDIALLVDKKVENAEIVKTINVNGGANLKDVKLFDLYQGDKIDLGFKSLAYTLTYSNSQRTLTDEEVNQSFDKIVSKLNEQFDAKVR